MLNALSHIATVLPTPSKMYCKKTLLKVNRNLLKQMTHKARSSIVSQDVIFAPKTNNGLGLQRVSTFWSSIKMGWFRRLWHNSFWKTLHLEDLKDEKIYVQPI